jgi:ATP-dependent protease HslVU (ClpYQ) peptidase subunit
MSLVIGVSYNEKSIIAADSGGFNSSNGNFEVVKSPRKIQKIEGVLYGLVNSWEDIQVLKEIKTESKKSVKPYHMKKVLRRFEEKKGDNGMKGIAIDSQHIVRLYNSKAPRHLSPDKHKFAAVGCGKDWVEGYMHAKIKDFEDPEELVSSTFSAIQDVNKFVEPPIRKVLKNHQ